MIYTLLLILFFPIMSLAQGIFAGDTSSANIIYRDIKDTLLSFGNSWEPSPNFSLDIDNDSVADIRFNFSHSASPGYSSDTKSVFSLTNIEFYYASNNLYVDTIANDSLINSLLNWKNITTGNKLRATTNIYLPPPGSYTQGGNFIRKNNYLAFRKIFSSDTLYGWVLLDMSNTIKIKSYAIEKTENNIGFQELKNKSSENIIIYPNPITDNIIGVSTITEFDEFVLHDILGKSYLIQSSKINNGYQIQLPPIINSDIYFLIIKKGGNSVIKKTIVNISN